MAVTAEEMDLPRRTLMWVAGAFLSMFLFAAVIALSYTLGAREGGFGNPPLIHAAEGPYKIVPDQPGGQSFPHQKIGVYDRISGDQTASAEVLLPPSEQPVVPNLIPKSTPRVVDDQPFFGDSESDILSVVLPTPEAKNMVVLDTATSGESMPAPQPVPAPKVVATDDQTDGRELPPAETVQPDTIAGLINQSSDVEAPVSTDQPNPQVEASSLKVETVEVASLRETIVPQATRLEPVVAEDLMVDPARIVDDQVASSDVMASPDVMEVVASEQQPLEDPKVADAAPEKLPQEKPVASAIPSSEPKTAKPELILGQQIAAVDLNEQNPPEITPKAMPAGAFLIQIGAFRKKAEAESAWRRASKSHKDLIAQLQPSIQRADLGKRGIYYRLQAGPLENKTQARSLCKLLQQRKLACLVPKR